MSSGAATTGGELEQNINIPVLIKVGSGNPFLSLQTTAFFYVFFSVCGKIH